MNGRSGKLDQNNRGGSPWGVRAPVYSQAPRNYYGEPDAFSSREKDTDFWGSSQNSQPKRLPPPPAYGKQSPKFGANEPSWNSYMKPRDSSNSNITGDQTPQTKAGPAVNVNEDDRQPKVDFEEVQVPKYDYLRGRPRDVKPLPYKEPVIDLNSRRDVATKVDMMKDIIKKLVYHIDPELVPKEEDPAKCEEKHKCEGIVAHTLAKL